MARTFDQIKTEIKVQIRTFPSLDTFLFPEDGGSNFSVFNIFIDVAAASNFLTETVIEGLKTDTINAANRAPSLNTGWLRQQMFNWQYTDIIELDSDFVPFYPVPDTAKQIITRCAVTDRAGGGVNIKVAKGVVPTLSALTAGELSALTDYYYGTSTAQGIGGAGIAAQFVSADADRMKVGANIYYIGQYDSDTVKTNVITAIDTFFTTFADTAFDGTVFMIKLTDAIQAIDGVSRVEYTDVKARDSATLFADAQNVDFQGFYKTFAGYIVSEDEPGETLNDSIIMALETV